MEHNYKELLEKDSQFNDCYLAATNPNLFDRKVGIHGAQSFDIDRLCKSINELHRKHPYNTQIVLSGKSYQFLWYATGQLLLGTAYIYNLQVKSVFDQSNRLKDSLSASYFVIQKTQTIKRKTNEVIDKRGSKKKRTEVQVENYQCVTFWEEEENEAADVEDFAAAWGENVTDDHNITLLEDIPLSLRATDGDEQNELPYFSDGEFESQVYNSSLQRSRKNAENRRNSRLTYDDHGNDKNGDNSSVCVEPPSSRQMNVSPSRQSLDETENEVINDVNNYETDFNPERNLNENAIEQGLNIDQNNNNEESENDERDEEPVEHQQQKKKTKKPKRKVFDKVTELNNKTVDSRVSNPFVGCNQRLSNATFVEKLQVSKEPNLFQAPTNRNSRHITELYTRNLQTKEADDSLTDILGLILNMSIVENESENEAAANEASRIVRDQVNIADEVLPPRRSSLRLTSMRESVAREPTQPPIEPEICQEYQPIVEEQPDILLPPIEFDQPDILLPPIEFDQNNNNSIENNINDSPPEMHSHASNSDENSAMVQYVLRCTPDSTGFSDGGNELCVLKLLITLWKEDVHPIGMDKINKVGESRLRAAKNFAALLVLEKRRYIHIEHTDDRQVYHIEKGIALNRG